MPGKLKKTGRQHRLEKEADDYADKKWRRDTPKIYR